MYMTIEEDCWEETEHDWDHQWIVMLAWNVIIDCSFSRSNEDLLGRTYEKRKVLQWYSILCCEYSNRWKLLLNLSSMFEHFQVPCLNSQQNQWSMDITSRTKKTTTCMSSNISQFFNLHVVINLPIRSDYSRPIVQLIDRVNQLFHLVTRIIHVLAKTHPSSENNFTWYCWNLKPINWQRVVWSKWSKCNRST